MTFDFSFLNLAILLLMLIFGITSSYLGKFYLTFQWVEKQFEFHKVPMTQTSGITNA